MPLFLLLLVTTFIDFSMEIIEKVETGRPTVPFFIKEQQFYYVNITNPEVDIQVKCAHCNAERCRPLPFCYSIQYQNQEKSVGDYCADEAEMFSLVGSQLDATTSSHGRKRRRILERCIPSINDDTIAYCVCQTFDDDESSREYNDLRRIRIWRYQSLIFHHDDMQRKNVKKGGAGKRAVEQMILVIMCIWYV